MKAKILAILLLVAAGCGLHHAQAQISVKSQTPYKVIKTIRMGYVKVSQTGDRISLVLRSTNDFEDPLLVFLGNSPEQAAATMDGIVDLYQVIDKGVTTFDGPDGARHDVTRGMSGNMYFIGTGKAGDFIMGKGEAKRCAEAIRKLIPPEK